MNILHLETIDQPSQEAVQSFAETLAFIVAEVYNSKEYYDKLTAIMPEDETSYISRLNELINWAKEFEIKNDDREWDGEWMDELDTFIKEKLTV